MAVYLVGMKEKGKPRKRPYRMAARAEAAAATREKILQATESAFDELQFDDLTLAEVAKRAGVSVQTILRHFGTREELLMATLQHSAMQMAGSRGIVPSGDVEEVVDGLVDHYEEFADRLLRLLAQEDRQPALRFLTDIGRQFHLEWCKEAFAPALTGLRGAERTRRAYQLAAITDIYVWKILRRDRGLSRPQTKLAIRELLEPLMERSG